MSNCRFGLPSIPDKTGISTFLPVPSSTSDDDDNGDVKMSSSRSFFGKHGVISLPVEILAKALGSKDSARGGGGGGVGGRGGVLGTAVSRDVIVIRRHTLFVEFSTR